MLAMDCADNAVGKGACAPPVTGGQQWPSVVAGRVDEDGQVHRVRV